MTTSTRVSWITPRAAMPPTLAALLLLASAAGAQQRQPGFESGATASATHLARVPTPQLLLIHRDASVQQEMAADSSARSDAMLNAALIALGALGIFDNVVVHWMLGWHRAIEGSPYNLQIELGIVAVSTAMLVTGLVRERRARATRKQEQEG